MFKSVLLLFSLILFFGLIGCGEDETVSPTDIPAGTVGPEGSGVDAIQLVGEWTGQVMTEEDPIPGEEPEQTPEQRDAAVNALLGGYQLNLYEDRTFSFSFGMFPVSGVWTVTGGLITLETDSAMGRSREQVIDGEFSENVKEQILEMFQNYELRYDVEGRYLEYIDAEGNVIRFTR